MLDLSATIRLLARLPVAFPARRHYSRDAAMVPRTFAELVRDLRLRRTVGDKPPVLLLGAGASVDAGIGAMKDLFAFFGVPDFAAFVRYIAGTTAAERYRYLSEFLQTRKPDEVTSGYQALATLCAQNYFDLVLTTNMDPLLDDALAAARLWRRDYLLMVNGVIRPDRLDLLLGSQSPRVKIVKLHGDLFQRFMAWTVEEMDDFLTQISPALKQAVAGRDVLVVGHSLRDERIRDLAQSTGGALWFTHPQQVPDHLAGNDTMRTVIAPEVAFERFFPALARALQLETPALPKPEKGRQFLVPAPAADGGQTLDDVLASVMSVLLPDGTPSSTAFLLASPRIIVCDAFAADGLVGAGRELSLLAADHQRFKARVLRTDRAHPFGPMLLEVPESVKVPGLRLDTDPVRPGDVVQIAVAAGTQTGISTGQVNEKVSRTAIAPIGEVRNLASLNALVRPGSSGAPVVDSAMSVRGFIVAGSQDETRPVSFMYPSEHWSNFVSDRKARKTVSARKTRARKKSSKR
jgi:CheY-like chemotaxis protein